VRLCQHPDCGAEVEPPKRRWCSERCARDAYHQEETDRRQAARRATVRACPWCGEPVRQGGTRGHLRTYCTTRCAKAARRSRAP
jgi:endogenous inhibitor of DNA gyrase (YacG/DUF329 family)